MAEEEKENGRSNKPRGWYSRLHQNDDNRREARASYLAEHGPEARRRKAEERAEARAQRSAAEQLRILDQRFGAGQGAKRERARLKQLINAS